MKLKKIFTLLLVMLPILSLYSIPNSKFLIFEAIILFLYPFMLCSMFKKNEKVDKIFYFPLLIPFIYIILQYVFISFVKCDNIYVTSLKTLHNIFYIITAIVFIKQFFDIELGIKLLKYISIFSTLYIIVQSILINTIGYYLPGTLPFLPTAIDEFNETIMISGLDVRPRAIFSEPSAFAAFIALFLIVDLFSGEKHKLSGYIVDIFVSLGLLLARSTTGYLMGFMIWLCWGLYIFFKGKSKKKGICILVIIIILPIIAYIISKTSSYSIFIEHTFGNDANKMGIGVINRIGNYRDAFSVEELENAEVLFGRGMQNINYYIPGIPRMFYYFGILGMLIWFSVYLYIFFISNWTRRRVLILMIVISFFGDSLFGINYLVYFPFIINLPEPNKDVSD